MEVEYLELIDIANKFLEENYDMKLGIPIELNKGMIKNLGVFRYIIVKGKPIPYKIQLSTEFMFNQPREHIIDILKHELVHYALCVNGYTEKQFNDGHPIFEGELRRLGIKGAYSYDHFGDFHVYTCDNCGEEHESKRKLTKTTYCNCSEGPNLTYRGIVNKKHPNMDTYQGE